MSLIVENGTGLATADSYISLADARVYALKYGYTLPDDDTEADVSLRQGTIYVDLFEGSFAGQRLVDAQALSWPRIYSYKCAGRDQIPLASDSIPLEIQYAQVIAASFYASGLNVRANDDGIAVASKEVVGAVKVSYFDNGKTGKAIEITEAIDKLSNFLCAGSMLTMQTLRV